MKINISCGSYNSILYGLDVTINDNDDNNNNNDSNTTTTIKEAFAIPAHKGHITAITSSTSLLATGASDESVRIFDLQQRKDLGTLMEHEGRIKALALNPQNTHLITGGEDGLLLIWRRKDWELLKKLRHGKPLTSLSIHPSGLLMISVGEGRSLKIWDLTKGKEVASVNLSSVLSNDPLQVSFSPKGDHYAIRSDYQILIYQTKTNEIVYEKRSPGVGHRYTCQTWMGEDDFLYYGEEASPAIGKITISTKEDVKIPINDLEPRVKAATTVGDILILCSSSGTIKGFRGDKEIFSHHSKNLRITCITASAIIGE